MGSGIVIATVGGLAGSEEWLYAGTVLLVAGLCALYAFGIVKNPKGVVKAEMDVEEQFSGYPPRRVEPERHETGRVRQEEEPPKR